MPRQPGAALLLLLPHADPRPDGDVIKAGRLAPVGLGIETRLDPQAQAPLPGPGLYGFGGRALLPVAASGKEALNAAATSCPAIGIPTALISSPADSTDSSG